MMRVFLDDCDRLHVLPFEDEHSGNADLMLYFVFGAVPVIVLLALKAYLFLLIISPFIGLFLLLSAFDLLVSNSTAIDRVSGLILAQRRFLFKRASRVWKTSLITGIQICEGQEYVPRLGNIPEFRLYLVSGPQGEDKREVPLGKALSREDADEAATHISRYADWPIRHVFEQQDSASVAVTTETPLKETRLP
jgi:hypothetical protein